MSFVFIKEERVADSARRVIRERVEAALSCIGNSKRPLKKRYHEARKELKRARAALRLVRDEIGRDHFRAENIRYRDAAREMGGVRDLQLLEDTLEKLLSDARGKYPAKAFVSVEKALSEFTKEKLREVEPPKDSLAEVTATLEEGARRVEAFAIEREGWKAIGGGLERVYRAGRESSLAAYADPSAHNFHEWRKNVKYLRHQIELLRDCWPMPFENIAEELHVLSDTLGEDHDLAVLQEVLSAFPKRFGTRATLKALFDLIQERQRVLREAAEPLGRRLYAEKPRAFVKRVREYWKAWHSPLLAGAGTVPVAAPGAAKDRSARGGEGGI